MQKNIIYENIITLIVSIENISKAKTIIILKMQRIIKKMRHIFLIFIKNEIIKRIKSIEYSVDKFTYCIFNGFFILTIDNRSI